jgi:Fis family transcriptional regulator, factor for inversion stimulation protein
LSSNRGKQDLCLRDVVDQVVRQYLDDMGETEPDNLHALIMSTVEEPLIAAALDHAGGNQSRTAAILGITRTTLRNRIKRYQLDQD